MYVTWIFISQTRDGLNNFNGRSRFMTLCFFLDSSVEDHPACYLFFSVDLLAVDSFGETHIHG